MPGPQLTLEAAQKVLGKYLNGLSIISLKELPSTGYSYNSHVKTYILDLSGQQSCMITISDPKPDDSPLDNSLAEIYDLVCKIRNHTDIPIPETTFDNSLELVPFHFIISPAAPVQSSDIISLAVARKSGYLNDQVSALIDLQIGRFLGQLHRGVQNDWFGTPSSTTPTQPSHSWQESFTPLLERLLAECEASGVSLPYHNIRLYLSRAIGSFLFDDVEVPSLVWLSGFDDDIYIFIPSEEHPNRSGIAAICSNLSHAVWGDPLLESFFAPPGPTFAILEGYTATSGGPLITFPRQRTKRLWYNLFLALIVLKERRQGPLPEAVANSEINEKWAFEAITKAVEELKDAPTY